MRVIPTNVVAKMVNDAISNLQLPQRRLSTQGRKSLREALHNDPRLVRLDMTIDQVMKVVERGPGFTFELQGPGGTCRISAPPDVFEWYVEDPVELPTDDAATAFVDHIKADEQVAQRTRKAISTAKDMLNLDHPDSAEDFATTLMGALGEAVVLGSIGKPETGDSLRYLTIAEALLGAAREAITLPYKEINLICENLARNALCLLVERAKNIHDKAPS